MKLLDEIIEGAVSDTQPIGTVLRKCLVLERQVKNEKFRTWLNNELDGYDSVDDLPDYRAINSISRGFFVGYGGSQINDHTNIVAGDASGLLKALSDLGVTEEGLKALQHDIEADKQDGNSSATAVLVHVFTQPGSFASF
jgi:hypothetical protein